MTPTDICYLPATEALKLFREKKLSPVELLKAQIERTESLNGQVNAIVMDYFDDALIEARRAERAYMSGSARPLEGLSVAVKDEHNIKGKRMTNGSLLLKDNVSTYTDPLCERILEAGGIVHARTATPEFSANYSTWSKLWGITRNPWNLACSAGGSSGGSGVALATGMTTLATGSDIGGSIRAPASQNAVVGYKPPHGRVPKYPPWNLVHYNTDGPLARTVGDLILFENVIAGPHRCDMTSLKPKYFLPAAYAPVKGMRIACCLTMGGKPIDADVRDNTLAMAARFRDLGANVDEVDIGWDDVKAGDAAKSYMLFHLAGVMTLNYGAHPDFEALSTPYVRYLIAKSKQTTPETYFAYLSYETFMYDCLRRVFDTYEILMCPTMSTASFKADFDYSKDKFIINGGEQATIPGPEMTGYFNTLSRCPTLAVPSGFDRNNVPTGIQIVGPTYEEEPVFRAAMVLESSMPPLFVDNLSAPAERRRRLLA
jgi:Asp-tRNA(Asn)/Glu-tRNA(Gln) amidotransferase A subunit family amidase